MEGNIITNTMKMVAVNFAEWIVREFWIVSSNDLWYQKSDGNPDEGLTTEEIYELFLEAERRRIEINTPKLQLPLADVSGAVCPICKSDELVDIDDHYTKCCKCGFSFVG